MPTERADDDWMGDALLLAYEATLAGEVPVGCILVVGGVVVGRGNNRRERTKDPTAHAELVAVREAAAARKSWRLDDVTAFVTLEPCPMCAGAFVNARVRRVVYGCADPKAGAVESLFDIGKNERLNHRFDVTRGVRETECADRLRAFFAALRAQGKK
ncbi:tRNA adenosine(34) deaminase TadA [soil metagenome]